MSQLGEYGESEIKIIKLKKIIKGNIDLKKDK